MTNIEMLDMLGLRCADPDYRAYSTSTRYKVLNLAQMQVVNTADNGILTELETSETVTLDANGKYDLSTLTYTPIRNGIFAVYNNSASVGAYVNLIEFKDVKRLENTFMSASSDNPVGYVFADHINIKPANTDSVTIYHLRKPLDIASDQDCELDESLHEIVVGLSEALLWRMDGDYTKANVALESSMGFLKALNERYAVEKPQGVGTYGRVTPGSTKGA